MFKKLRISENLYNRIVMFLKDKNKHQSSEDNKIDITRSLPNAVIHRSHLRGIVDEILDYSVSIINFPGTLATCVTISTILGLASFGPAMAVFVMGVLAALGMYCAHKHFKKSKAVRDMQVQISYLKNRLHDTEQECEKVRNKIKLLMEKITADSDNEKLTAKVQQIALDALAEMKAKEKDASKKTSYIEVIKNQLEKFRDAHPKLVYVAKVSLNIGLGLFSAYGLVGTAGVFLGGVSALSLLLTPLGLGIFIVGVIACVSLNMYVFQFSREKLSQKYHQSKKEIQRLKDEIAKHRSEIELGETCLAKMAEECGDSVKGTLLNPVTTQYLRDKDRLEAQNDEDSVSTCSADDLVLRI